LQSCASQTARFGRRIKESETPTQIRALRCTGSFFDEQESCRQTDVTRRGVIFRRERIRRAQTAIRLTSEQVPWLPSAADLSGGFAFSWRPTEPHHNVTPLTGNRGSASLVYLGENPETQLVEQMYSKLRNALERHAVNAALTQVPRPDLNIVARRASERLCVAFRRDGQVKVFRPADYASFVDPADASAVDITRREL
jgi:hypothetical protein